MLGARVRLPPRGHLESPTRSIQGGGPTGVETFLAEAGFRFFFIDTHMAEAGESLGSYAEVPHGVERFDGSWEGETWRNIPRLPGLHIKPFW